MLFSTLYVVIIIMRGHQSFSYFFCFSDWGRNCYVKTSSRSKGETVSRNQTAVGYNSMVTAKGWISPAVSKSTRNSDVCFLIFVAVHETLWCNHCRYKTSLTAQYFCTVVTALAHCSFPTYKTLFQDLYNWWKETSERKQDNMNLCKTKWSVTEKQQLSNKYKQAWILMGFHRKSVRFLKDKIYFTKKNFPSWNRANILSEWFRNPGLLRVKVQKIFQWGAWPRPPIEAYAFGAHLGNWSVFILDPCLTRSR